MKGEMIDIGSAEWKKIIADGAGFLGVAVSSEALDHFSIHAAELVRWTRKSNLTAITGPMEVAVKHFLDSIAVAGLIPLHGRLLDVGSGGGFPGLPLKVVTSALSVTLIDAVRKKVSFLNHVIGRLKLKDIAALHLRSEQMPPGPLFDCIVSRAVASLSVLVPTLLPLLAADGMIIAMKGTPAETDAECRALLNAPQRLLPGASPLDIEMRPYALPRLEAQRTLVIVRQGGRCRRAAGPQD